MEKVWEKEEYSPFVSRAFPLPSEFIYLAIIDSLLISEVAFPGSRGELRTVGSPGTLQVFSSRLHEAQSLMD